MNEKQRIEQASAEGFLLLYNRRYGAGYRIVKLGDAPDVRCQSSSGEELNLEITLTEDCPRDIQASLGRSNHRSAKALAEHIKKVAEGKEEPQVSSLSGNVLAQAADRINGKLVKSYGPNTALVVQDTSPLVWGWDSVIEELRQRTKWERSPFDKGIWILNYAKTQIYQVI